MRLDGKSAGIDQRLTKVQLLQAFEAALAVNNVALVRNGDSLTVTEASAGNGTVVTSTTAPPATYAPVTYPPTRHTTSRGS